MCSDMIGGFEKVWLPIIRQALPSSSALRTWFEPRFAPVLPDNVWVTNHTLDLQIMELMRWAQSQDGGESLLQKFADDPPNGNSSLPSVIFLITEGRILSKNSKKSGPQTAEPHMSFFATGRPFVNREQFRNQLGQLPSAKGAKRIVKVHGESRSGKSFSTRLAKECHPAKHRVFLDVKADYQEFGRLLNAFDLAKRLGKFKEDIFPSYDISKEKEMVPKLVEELETRLQEFNDQIWIIIDHCKCKSMTEPACTLLMLLVKKIENQDLDNVRLILVDCDLTISSDIQHKILIDAAKLPDKNAILEWAEKIVSAERLKCSRKQLEAWISCAWEKLESLGRESGEWELEYESQLEQLHTNIMNCEALK